MLITKPQELATLDDGGGLMLNGAFVIHTAAATLSATSIMRAACRAAIDDKLSTLALEISQTLSFHTLSEATTSPDLWAGSCPDPSKTAPWFFVNAAASSRHCVVGEVNAVHGLASILQRPWCVLELCCLRDCSILQKLEDFVLVCRDIPKLGTTYRPAHRLLAMELRLRMCAPYCWTLSNPRLGKGSVKRQLSKLSADLFRASLTSWNGIWLRALCSIAIVLRVTPAEMARALGTFWTRQCHQTGNLSASVDRGRVEFSDTTNRTRTQSWPTSSHRHCQNSSKRPKVQELLERASSVGTISTPDDFLKVYLQIMNEIAA